MESYTYILMNGKRAVLDYNAEYDIKKGLVRIAYNNECFASRRYGTFSPYQNMTYDTQVRVGGKVYVFNTNNVMVSEGIAVYCAIMLGDVVSKIREMSAEQLIGYAVNFGSTRTLWDMGEKLPF